MPVLTNPRHEAFAQALASGNTAGKAYALAGFHPHRGNAARLRANERIQGRVAEILGKAAERVEVNAARVLEELARVGMANMRDYINLDTQGQPHINLTDLDEAQWAAIQEVTVEHVRTLCGEEGEPLARVERAKFKLHDKRQALVAIGRHLGMFADKGTGLPANAAPAGSDQPQRLPEEALAEMAGRYRAPLRVIEGNGKANRTDDY